MIDFDRQTVIRKITLDQFLSSVKPVQLGDTWEDSFPEIVVIGSHLMQLADTGVVGIVRDRNSEDHRDGQIFIPMPELRAPPIRLDLTRGTDHGWSTVYDAIDRVRKSLLAAFEREGVIPRPLYITGHKRPGLRFGHNRRNDEVSITTLQVECRVGVAGWSGKL